jgi:hypothetical protein
MTERLDQVAADSVASTKKMEDTWVGVKNTMEEAGRTITDLTTDIAAAAQNLMMEGGKDNSEVDGEKQDRRLRAGDSRTGQSYADTIKETLAEHVVVIARTELQRR